ncbi:uncharacterized protein LOC106134790 [Amyelois transitella]|uniref:uncharacterized protein LOC106134790 n=1 Tax=Amyelois transitella TaxID=680683 RepID=UPI00067B1ACE|nr:uncharacterized protein LOC106134790 [Amyelois transitella]
MGRYIYLCSVAYLLLQLLSYVADGSVISGRDDIPPLCLISSITPVSCSGPVGPDSLVPHPDDCRLFYYCVSPARPPVCRQCPADLHFSPTEHVCDTADHAGCTAKGSREF